MRHSRDRMREEGIHKLEVHVAAICVRDNGKGRFEILIGKRTPNRQLFPGYWECGGGQVFTGENFEVALERQIKGEFNIAVTVEYPVGTYEIKTNGAVIPGLRFICRPKDKQQEATVNPEELSECRWIDENSMDAYGFIPGLKEDIKKALSFYRKILGT
jgi:8-oxo-dGTP pyrophosphatase MutT (NUDIX family)